MKNFWRTLLTTLESNNSIILLVVAKSEGSTPGRQGFKMFISEDSSQYGTIGGGVMEQNFITLAQSLFESQSSGFNLKLQIHHKYAPEEQQSGLICSGKQWVIYGLIKPTKDNISYFKQVVNYRDTNLAQHSLAISPDGYSFVQENELLKENKQYGFDYQSDSNWNFYENLHFKNKLYILGGGHVGLAISKVFSLLDFYIIVIDNRTGLETIKQNVYAHKYIIDKYANSSQYIEEGTSTYVVVVTTSVITDIEALTFCLRKKVRYLGVMGSRSKRKEIFAQLTKKGFNQEILEKINCPIGIESVKTNTAEEIAVSVATEIIKIKNENMQ